MTNTLLNSQYKNYEINLNKNLQKKISYYFTLIGLLDFILNLEHNLFSMALDRHLSEYDGIRAITLLEKGCNTRGTVILAPLKPARSHQEAGIKSLDYCPIGRVLWRFRETGLCTRRRGQDRDRFAASLYSALMIVVVDALGIK